MNSLIPFNKPYIAGKELHYIAQAVTLGNISGDGEFARRSASIMEERFKIHKVLLTPSCTAALELSAMLVDIQPGDEVIMPSYTFVSTANAFARMGAKPVFVDIRPDTLNLDDRLIEQAITEKTKAIVPVHYAGVACEMELISTIAEKYNLKVIEDAAQGVNSLYHDQYLGSIGELGCYSFHETKNFICGEGGAICLNSEELVDRAHILRDKGTNRQAFFQGLVDKYTWCDIGSSFVLSEINCAFLYAQLEMFDQITQRRQQIFDTYYQSLLPLEQNQQLRLPCIPEDCTSNHHMFYILLPNKTVRDGLMNHLKQKQITAVFHFVPLHTSPMGEKWGYKLGDLPISEQAGDCLLRLPFYYEITADEQKRVISEIQDYLSHSVSQIDRAIPLAFPATEL
ncbi:MAG: dTDP-4-amino-4,6-dideoxygalactose transaminase [Planctomycetes bacterium]|uniref:dTDP-4-amino-4,6-dideoxygalactose transaminase n=1 Tax=uncultured Gimesia sp. TaxID=1678688 RepID=UPI002602544D|nr:dTDP-4-amino-4,6-dideoxygalactose transaminase [uncultured Gimesia sp.]MCH9656600.1 dTDP-4-amino-4,6-dideoxygalactose transaminase [Planctomycetota bacterium]MCH9727642.1 dTDP-4-amino-4,6-dideoxygalactose transaminase [Planctomycetota bacterium]MCH9779125.1 dTDP-4-amino-4,6-dideoxygalactose transaminase [Planctomycetota bacterium]